MSPASVQTGRPGASPPDPQDIFGPIRPGDMVLSPTGLRFRGRHFPCTIGRGGVRTDKREGDGATPTGAHRIIGMLYRPGRIARPADWAVPIRPGDLWCDDPVHEDYNLMVRAPFAASHERLKRPDPGIELLFGNLAFELAQTAMPKRAVHEPVPLDRPDDE